MLAGPVLHVIAPSPAGGAESVVVALAAARPEQTLAVVLNQVVDASAPPHPIALQLRRHGVTTHEVRCGRRRYGAETREVQGLLRRLGVAVVHTHGYHGTWVGGTAARRLGIPTVATVHGYLTRGLRERLYNLIDRRMLRRFDAIIAVSPGIRDQLVRSGVETTRVHLVQNGLTTSAISASLGDRDSMRREHGVGPEELLVGWIGRLSPEKGADLFLHALAESAITARGFVVGDGPERARLEALSRALGLADQNRVRFLGFVPDASRLLPGFDLLALTSRMEGTPMVILEAVAAGIPIVAFEVGGIPDLLSAESAFLVPRESIPGLAAAFRTVVEIPQEARHRANVARVTIGERLSLQQWLDRVWKVYELAAGPS